MINTKRFRTKPSEIEAVKWTGGNLSEIEAFGVELRYAARWDEPLKIKAGKDGESGFVPLPLGHWVARNAGDLSDHWPLNPEQLQRKYEAVAE